MPRFPFRDTAKLCDLMMCLCVQWWWIAARALFTVWCRIFAWLSNLYVCITLLLPQLIQSLPRASQQFPLHSFFSIFSLALFFQHSLCHINWYVFSEESELGFVYSSFHTRFFFSVPPSTRIPFTLFAGRLFSVTWWKEWFFKKYLLQQSVVFLWCNSRMDTLWQH